MTNFHLELPGGTETWIKTIGLELSKRGHDVTIFTFKKGEFAKRLERLGLYITDSFDSNKNFDIALINHNSCLELIRRNRKNSYPLLFTSHGPNEELEKPVRGADYYFAVSEEVQERCKSWGFEAEIMRNPIDCETFNIAEPINVKIRTILALSHHKDVQKQIRKIGRKLKAKVILLGHKMGNISWEVQNEINSADLVVTLGRGCLESMACGRNVIVHGAYGADGYVDDESIGEFRKFNCSGRRYGKDFSKINDFVQEATKYDPKQGEKNRKYILENNDVKIIVEKYLKVIM